jgi:glucose dehydrogenase
MRRSLVLLSCNLCKRGAYSRALVADSIECAAVGSKLKGTPMVVLACARILAPQLLGAADRDWSENLGGPDRAHYSTLDQINVASVGTLARVWEFHTGVFGQMQCNPLVVEGVLFGIRREPAGKRCRPRKPC